MTSFEHHLTVREFYFKDKKTNAAYRGVVPHNDVDCPPFDYFRFLHAEMCFKNFSWMLSVKCPIKMPDKYVRNFVLDKTDQLIADTLSKTDLKPEIHQLLIEDNLSYSQQNKLLKGLTLNAAVFCGLIRMHKNLVTCWISITKKRIRRNSRRKRNRLFTVKRTTEQ